MENINEKKGYRVSNGGGLMKKSEEIRQLVSKTVKHGSTEYARQSLGWSKRRLKKVSKEHRFPLDWDSRETAAAMATSADLLANKINDFLEAAVPTSLEEKFKLAHKYGQQNDRVGDIVKIKAYLMNADFSVHSTDEEDEQKIVEFNREYRVDQFITQLAFQAMIHDHMIPAWKKSRRGQGIQFLTVMDPRYLKIYPKTGESNGASGQIFRKGVAQKVVKFRQDPELGNQEKILRRFTGFGGEWRDWTNTNGQIEVRTYNGYHDRMVAPRMAQIFPDLALRQLIRDGNFATFYHLKRMIHLIKVGLIDEGMGNNPVYRALARVDQDTLNDVMTKIKKIDKTQIHAVPNDQEHEFVAPPIEYMKLENFQAVDDPIIDWSDIGFLLQGGTSRPKYASLHMQAKKALTTIQYWRNELRGLLEIIYRDVLNIQSDIHIQWNEHIFLEPKQLLERIKTAQQQFGLSPQTAQRSLGFNPDIERRQNRAAWENPEDYFPVYEPSQGITASKLGYGRNSTSPGEPGRPNTEGPQSDDNDSGQQPRPSQE